MTATINSIKDTLAELVGEKIIVTIEAGRRKTTIHEGKLTDTYPSLFIVELDGEGSDSYERVSFSYTDILTDSIEVVFPNRPEITLGVEEEKEDTEEVN